MSGRSEKPPKSTWTRVRCPTSEPTRSGLRSSSTRSTRRVRPFANLPALWHTAKEYTRRAAVRLIGDALLGAKSPLIVTSYLGRNLAAVEQLQSLVDLLAIPVLQTALSNVNLPFTHPSHTGLQFSGPAPIVEESDVILIIDSDVPWCGAVHSTETSE